MIVFLDIIISVYFVFFYTYGMKNPAISEEVGHNIYSPGDTTFCLPCYVTF